MTIDDRFVCIIGPDGAGKSTQAELLIEHLSREGRDCEYRWLGFNHYLSLPLLALARLFGLSEMERLPSGRKVGYHYFERSKLVSTLYPVLLLIDTCIAYLLEVSVPRRFSDKTIVFDRFIHDTIVNIMLSTNQPGFLDTVTGRLFIRLIPDDVTVYVLIADAETLRSRRDDVRADENLDRKVEFYSAISTELGLQVVDASKSPREIHAEMRE